MDNEGFYRTIEVICLEARFTYVLVPQIHHIIRHIIGQYLSGLTGRPIIVVRARLQHRAKAESSNRLVQLLPNQLADNGNIGEDIEYLRHPQAGGGDPGCINKTKKQR